MKTVYFTSFFVVIILSFSSCKKESEPEPETKTTPKTSATIKFQADVQPIFDSHCNGAYCHGGGADGKYYNSHANTILVPKATLIGAINHSSGFEPMPKSSPKLRQGQIDTITTWISEGRLNN